jgi:small-conductance mechanosensitive channel
VVKSNLYFAIFEEFKKAGIEIPFPQQEIRIRSGEEGAQARGLIPGTSS